MYFSRLYGRRRLGIVDPMDGVQLIDSRLLDRLVTEAADRPRRRINHNFHASLSENPNRMLNAMLRDTYVRPHRHLDPPKCESFVVLRGRLAILVFSDDGRIDGCHVLGTGPGELYGIDLAPGIFHSIVVLSGAAVIFEVKPGPYEAATDKDFAEWAPSEGSPDALSYVEWMRAAVARTPGGHWQE